MPQVTYELSYDDYAQSANTLFHFMKNPEFLIEILQKKAIVPRYCKEDIEYLNIRSGDSVFREAYILQKCFCDIPFHKLTEKFQVRGEGENFQNLEGKESLFMSHPDFYGEYAISFSKSWGEKHNLQPIHYLNAESRYTQEFSALIEHILEAEDVPDLYAEDILNRLAFVKPLRGIMKRKVKNGNMGEVEIEFYKNFHDEQEWRYVPTNEELVKVKKESVIANPYILKMIDGGMDINGGLTQEQYRGIWLNYSYEDVRYIIVPNVNARIDIIHAIMNIPADKFSDQSDVLMQKQILISKILVLEEIRKDW